MEVWSSQLVRGRQKSQEVWPWRQAQGQGRAGARTGVQRKPLSGEARNTLPQASRERSPAHPCLEPSGAHFGLLTYELEGNTSVLFWVTECVETWCSGDRNYTISSILVWQVWVGTGHVWAAVTLNPTHTHGSPPASQGPWQRPLSLTWPRLHGHHAGD